MRKGVKSENFPVRIENIYTEGFFFLRIKEQACRKGVTEIDDKFYCKVKVVDEMMGMGKSSAAINYINSLDDDVKVMYVTPYLDEVERIKKSC